MTISRNLGNVAQKANSSGQISLTTGVSGTLPVANGGTGATDAAGIRTAAGATTVGSNLLTLSNPSAVTFPQFNADNTVSSLNASSFRTAIGAGTSSTTGTVTSVGGTGTVSGLTLSGTVTSSGNLTLGGAITGFLPTSGGTLTGSLNGTVGYFSSYVNTNGPYYRNSAGAGYFNGQYPSVESSATSGAIYSIGGSYVPGSTNLGTMYGIGYGYSGNAGITATGLPSSVWGLYGASGGTSRWFLDSDNGRGFFNGALYSGGNLVLTAGNYTSYAPSTTGSGASGTWGINISGTSSNGITTTTGSPPYYGARAWITVNGIAFTIYASANVSSLTNLGTGNYRVNFATAMPDTNYTVSGATKLNPNNTWGLKVVVENYSTNTTSTCQIKTMDGGSTRSAEWWSAEFFR